VRIRRQLAGPLLDGVRRDHAITQITMASEAQIDINGRHVRTYALTRFRGPALVSAVAGRPPSGNRDIMLGASTMRDTGARLGDFVRVTVTDPAGRRHLASFRVVGRAALNAGTGGLGNGAALTINGAPVALGADLVGGVAFVVVVFEVVVVVFEIVVVDRVVGVAHCAPSSMPGAWRNSISLKSEPCGGRAMRTRRPSRFAALMASALCALTAKRSSCSPGAR
jgi:hypothetical protein